MSPRRELLIAHAGTRHGDDSDLNAAKDRHRVLSRICESVEICFRAKFAVLDVLTGDYVFRGDFDDGTALHQLLDLCRAILENAKPDFIAESDPIGVLGIPLIEDEP